MDFVEKDKMFNEDYVYVSSMSKTMPKHFKSLSNLIKKQFSPKKVLEIGSNDGIFIKNFPPPQTYAVEPCSNFAKLTNDLGYKTRDAFWNHETSKSIIEEDGKMDLVFSANCICHIPDLEETFSAIYDVLNEKGIFIFEDPSLDNMIKKNSYDQIYDEHAHIFSIIALSNVLKKSNLEIFHVEKIAVHGGSNRVFVKKKNNQDIPINNSVNEQIQEEKKIGLNNFKTYEQFALRVEKSKKDLYNLLNELKKDNKKIIGYGATSKSTIVYNYCNIDSSLLDYVTDTTPHKQNKLTPGTHIPVVKPVDSGIDNFIDFAFLGAWNFKEEILKKEKKFLERGGKFITHVPEVMILD